MGLVDVGVKGKEGVRDGGSGSAGDEVSPFTTLLTAPTTLPSSPSMIEVRGRFGWAGEVVGDDSGLEVELLPGVGGGWKTLERPSCNLSRASVLTPPRSSGLLLTRK